MILVVMALLAAGADEPKVVHRVKVGDANYRVSVRGSDVEVAKKAFIVKSNLAERDAQREAVKLATGCRVVDELDFNEARLKGRLDCSLK